jgi:hypothetical protein
VPRHPSYRAMAEANGVQADDPTLARCRDACQGPTNSDYAGERRSEPTEQDPNRTSGRGFPGHRCEHADRLSRGRPRIPPKSRGSPMAEWRRTGLDDAGVRQLQCTS